MDEPAELGAGLWFTPNSVFGGEGYWCEVHGKLGVEMQRRRNFGLLLLVPRPAGERLSDNVLAGKVQDALHCVLLHGVPIVDFVTVQTGCIINGRPYASLRAQGQRYFPFWRMPSSTLDLNSLQTSASAFRTLDALYTVPTEYLRLKTGFRALVRTMREEWPEFRLHQNVRALEAVVKADDADAFAEHSATLARLACCRLTVKELRETYAMRSCAEHLNDYLFPLLRLGKSARAGAFRRGFGIERLALWSYKTILSVPGLVEHFVDDRSIKAHWGLSEADMQRAWTVDNP